jgi:hypothetical protein
LAPVDDCVFGDDILQANEIFTNEPPYQMKCQEFLNYAYTSLNKNALYYCSLNFFNKRCCSTCKSVFIKFIFIIMFINILAITPSLEYNVITCRDDYSNCPNFAAAGQCDWQFSDGSIVKTKCKRSCNYTCSSMITYILINSLIIFLK